MIEFNLLLLQGSKFEKKIYHNKLGFYKGFEFININFFIMIFYLIFIFNCIQILLVT